MHKRPRLICEGRGGTLGKEAIEARACLNCKRKKIKCDYNRRPCHSCIARGLEKECLDDSLIYQRACALCREKKRSCDKKRPCQRCLLNGHPEMCVPFVPTSSQKKFADRDEELDDQSLDEIDTDVAVSAPASPPNVGEIALIEPPAKFDVDRNLRVVQEVIRNEVSPMQIADCLASLPLDQFRFHMQVMSSFLTPRQMMNAFAALVEIMDSSMGSIGAMKQLNLAERLGEVLASAKKLAPGSTLMITDESSGNKVFNATLKSLELIDVEQKTVRKFLEAFKNHVKERFGQDPERRHLCDRLPELYINKMGAEGMQFGMNKIAESILGFRSEEMANLMTLRAERDLDLLSRSQRGGLSTDGFAFVPPLFSVMLHPEDWEVWIRTSIRYFLGSVSTIQEYLRVRSRSGRYVRLYVEADYAFFKDSVLCMSAGIPID